MSYNKRHVYKTLIEMECGYLAIIDFPERPTAFEQFPSGRFIVGDMFDGEIVYYRLNILTSFRNRGRSGSTAVMTEVKAKLKAYFAKTYGELTPVHGWSMLSDYVQWVLNPVGRILQQTPGTKLVPLSGDRGYELYMEFPQLIFFKMEPRVTCGLEGHKPLTVMAHEYEKYQSVVTAETVRLNYPRDGFFGRMWFDSRPYFFAMQVANLNRWNRLQRLDEFRIENVERTLSDGLSPDDLSIILHREISKKFSFMRAGTLGKPKDIQVLFKLKSMAIENLIGYENENEVA
jgi:hypothetical protein